MKCLIFFTILIPILVLADRTPFTIQAAGKQLLLEQKSGYEWSDYCFSKSLGCARFKIQGKSKNAGYGFVTVVTDKIEQKRFAKYCKDVFQESLSIQGNIGDFKESSTTSCSWKSKTETTVFMWKDGFSVMATFYSDQPETYATLANDVPTFLREAKVK